MAFALTLRGSNYRNVPRTYHIQKTPSSGNWKARVVIFLLD